MMALRTRGSGTALRTRVLNTTMSWVAPRTSRSSSLRAASLVHGEAVADLDAACVLTFGVVKAAEDVLARARYLRLLLPHLLRWLAAVAAAASFDAVRKGGSQSRRCFVGNLARRTAWQDLKDHFGQAGTVISSNVMKETSTSCSKGCSIVVYSAASEAARAIEMLQASVPQGRPISVREGR